MRILVTGKNGQVGHSLISRLNSEPEITPTFLDRTELDITDFEQVTKVVNAFKPNIIINAAAYTAVDKAESESEIAYAVNRDGPKNLAIAANSINSGIIHISTDYVFSGGKTGTYVETDNVAPKSVYGKSKLAGEQLVAEACPNHIILRTAWVFSEHGSNFVKTMLRVAQSRDTLGVVADQYGGPTFAGDIAATLILLAKLMHTGNSKTGIYHYAGSPCVSWYEFATTIFEHALALGVIPHPVTVNPITTADYPTPAARPANSKLDCLKIKRDYGIEPSDWNKALLNINKYI